MDHHEDAMSPFMKAALDGDVAVCASLLRAGADTNERLPEGSTTLPTGNTPLTLAAAGGHAHVCELLLQHGAQVDAVNSFGQTALFIATTIPGAEAVCELLLAYGADVDARASVAERRGYKSPLWVAASLGNERLCMLMIDKSKDLNAVGFRGETVLHQAAGQRLLAACSKLVERGADVNLLDVFATSPLGKSFEHHLLQHPAIFATSGRVASPPPDKLCVAVSATILRSTRVDVGNECNRRILVWLPRSMVAEAFNDDAWARRRAVVFRRWRRRRA